MTPEQLKEVIQLQKEIDELEIMRSRGIPSFLENRIHEVIADEIEARKIILADLGKE